MPTKHVSAANMAVGKKNRGGKHWTQREVEARQRAEEGIRRKTRVTMRAPEWLDDDALKIWRQVRKQASGLDLLDNLDAHMLGVYADALNKYRKLSGADEALTDEGAKKLQAWARLIAQYADKLGLTPAARARLAKKEADKELDGFGEDFD